MGQVVLEGAVIVFGQVVLIRGVCVLIVFGLLDRQQEFGFCRGSRDKRLEAARIGG